MPRVSGLPMTEAGWGEIRNSLAKARAGWLGREWRTVGKSSRTSCMRWQKVSGSSPGNSKARTGVNGWERVRGSEDLEDSVSSRAVFGGGGSCE